MIYIIISIALILIVLSILMWIAYTISAAYQQTITISIPFDETYRYVPTINKEKNYKLDKIKIVVTGTIKNEYIITHKYKIHNIITENIIEPYKHCLILPEADMFNANVGDLRRCPISKNPTIEILSILFFNKLEPLMPKIGCKLLSVKLISDNMKVEHSRYKISDYTV